MLRGITVALLVWSSLAGVARAQDQSQRKATANALFDEGRKLMAGGQNAAACAKFEASIAALPQLGTRLNLANCYELIGRVASAWAEFREAASLAATRGDTEREAFARAHIAALEPKLPRLSVTLGKETRTVELRVTRDDVVVLPALLDTAVPVDPGRHVVTASAPGFKTWRNEVAVAGEGYTLTVEIPALVPLSPEELAMAAGLPSPAVVARKRSTMRIAALATGAGGVVAAGVGTYFGLRARSKWNDSKAHCDSNTVCDQTGFDQVHDAKAAGNISTVAFGVGAAAIATGVILYLMAPAVPRDRPSGEARLEIQPSVSQPGISVRYRF